jgi:hypothetical protein
MSKQAKEPKDKKNLEHEELLPPGHETEAALQRQGEDNEFDDTSEVAGQPEPPRESEDDSAPDLEEFFRLQFGLDKAQERRREQDKKEKTAEEPKPQEKAEEEEKEEEESISKIAERAAAKAAELLRQKSEGAEQAGEPPIKSEQPPKDTTGPEEAFIQKLDTAEKRRLEVLARMEALYPDKYKGIRDRYLASLKEAEEYAAKWEAENPDETWRDEDHEDELAEIARKHQIAWDDDDYNEALVELKAEERLARIAEDVEKRLAEKQTTEAQKQQIAASIATDTDNLIRETVQEIRETLGSDDVDLDIYDSNGRLDQEKLAKIAEEDPIAYRTIVGTIAGGLAPAAFELMQIWRGVKAYDPHNPTHQWLDNFIIEKEQQIAALPKEKRVYNGKDFAPLEKYAKMSPAERERYWTLREEDALLMLRHHFAETAKTAYQKEIEVIEKWTAKKHGLAKDQAKGAPPSGQKPSKSTSGNKPLQASPSSISVPRGASKGAGAGHAAPDVAEEFLRELLAE